MKKIRILITVVCAASMLSCGGAKFDSPNEIINNFYTQLKKCNYEKAAEIGVSYFADIFDNDFRILIKTNKQKAISDISERFKEKNEHRRMIDFEIVEEEKDGNKVIITVKEIYEDDREREEDYTFVESDGAWICIDVN